MDRRQPFRQFAMHSLKMVILLLARKRIKQLKFYWSNLRVGKIILALMIYSFSGAAMFHWIETGMSDSTILAFGPGCLGTKSYWAALMYVNTLYSTIGYGSVYCCTWLGRLLTCIYIFIGAPMLLVVLESIGKILARLVSKLWLMGGSALDKAKLFVQQKVLKRKVHIVQVLPAKSDVEKNRSLEDGDDDDDDDEIEELIPLSAGLALALIWLFAAGLYFSYVEGWTYGSSLYYLWISITTVGLGDFAPARVELTIISFTLLFIGLAFMSMCVAILQSKIENMIKRMQADIKRQMNGLPPKGPLKNAGKGQSSGVVGKFMGNSEKKLMKMMMTSNQAQTLQQAKTKPEVKPRRKMHSKETQTTEEKRKTERVCDRHQQYLVESAAGDAKPADRNCSCVDTKNSIPCINCMPKLLKPGSCAICHLQEEAQKELPRPPSTASSRLSDSRTERSKSEERPRWQSSYKPL